MCVDVCVCLGELGKDIFSAMIICITDIFFLIQLVCL